MQLAPSLLFVGLLWYGIGVWMDRRWDPTEKTPWLLLAIFTSACLIGAFIPIGYTGYLPYGAVVWLAAAGVLRLVAETSRHRSS